MASSVSLFIALDVPSAARARAIARALAGLPVGLKIGLELLHAEGPALVRELRAGAPLFVDAKLHDIPQTVAAAAAALGRLGPTFVTFHALGGRDMLSRGVDALDRAARHAGFAPPAALAVTILTSHDEHTVRDEMGLAEEPARAAVRLARLAVEAGVQGVVCAPGDAAAVRLTIGPHAPIVTPGVRTGRILGDDQRRVATPAEAIRAGATALVVGRPVTGASDPRAMALAILADIERARGGGAA